MLYKINEYTVKITFRAYTGGSDPSYVIPDGTYYTTGFNIDSYSYQYMGTVEEDDVPDIMIGFVNVGSTYKQAEFNIQLDKLDPEKFPLFFV